MALFGGRGRNTGKLEEAGPWGMCLGCCVSPGLLSMPAVSAACHAGIYICLVCHALLPRTGQQQLWANIVPSWSSSGQAMTVVLIQALIQLFRCSRESPTLMTHNKMCYVHPQVTFPSASCLYYQRPCWRSSSTWAVFCQPSQLGNHRTANLNWEICILIDREVIRLIPKLVVWHL